MTEITQADRDAADEIMEQVDACGCKLCGMRVYEAFARHRMEATEELRAENERLRAALGEICKDSNPDWTEKRVYPDDVLDDIHTTAVNAYYKR